MAQKSKFTTLLALFLFAGACNAAYCQDFKADGWLADFAQIKQEMSAHYANLEWAIEALRS